MKYVIGMLVLVLSMLLSTTGYTTEAKPEKSVVSKSITVTTVQRPVRITLKNLNNKLNRICPLRKLRNKLRTLLNGTQDTTPVEERAEQ